MPVDNGWGGLMFMCARFFVLLGDRNSPGNQPVAGGMRATFVEVLEAQSRQVTSCFSKAGT